MATGYPGLTGTFGLPPPPKYVILVWQLQGPAWGQAVDAALRRAFEDRQHIELAPRVALIEIAFAPERDQLSAVIDYLAVKVHPGQFSYELSPPLPAGFWSGRREEGWDLINAITAGVSGTAATGGT